MTNVFLLGAKYTEEGKNINQDTLQEMWNIRSADFTNCGISENNFVYKICEDSFKASQDGRSLVNDEASHHALRSIADIGLFLSNQKAQNQKVEFDNPSQLLELLEASRTLKGVHPDLFDKYGFKQNLQTLVNLQLEKDNSMESRIQGAMDAIFEDNSPKKVTEKEDIIREKK